MVRRPILLILIATSLAPLLAPRSAGANERHFTYTYESAVLPQGAKELEFWVTPRLGRDSFYSRFDNRLEFEVGLTNRLQTSLYLNLNSITQDVMGTRVSETEFAGISSEWKYKLTDPVADPLGFALYGEVTASTNELELEAKLIFDKKVGDNVLLAANIVPEYEFEFEAGETETELVLEIDLAATYFFAQNWAIGLELRNHNEFPEAEEWEHSALFFGPTLGYFTQSWWVAATFLPQLPALKKPEGSSGSRVLDEHEKFNARVIFSFHL
jgi:hypothetical protein